MAEGTSVGSVFFDLGYNQGAFSNAIKSGAGQVSKVFGNVFKATGKQMSQQATSAAKSMATSYAKALDTAKLKASDTQIALDGVRQQMAALQNAAKQERAAIFENMTAKASEAGNELDKLIAKQQQIVEAQRTETGRRHNTANPSESLVNNDLGGNAQFLQIEEQINKLGTKYNWLRGEAQKAAQAMSAGAAPTTAAYQKLEAEASKLGTTLTQQTARTNYFEQALKQSTDEANKYAQSVGKASTSNSKFSQTSPAAAKGAKEVGKSFSQSVPAVKSFGGSLMKLGTMVKGLVIGRLIRNMVREVGRGFQDMAKVSSPFNDAMSQMQAQFLAVRNALVSIVAPIVQAVAPAITYLTNIIISAMNTLAAFTAKIFGGTATFLKAKVSATDYAESLGGVGSAAKAASGQLAAFDELNNLNFDDSSSGGGGTGVDPNDMWEEVEIADTLGDAFDDLIKKAQEMFDVFKKGFAEGAGDDFIASLSRTKDNILGIKDALIDIASDPAVIGAFESMGDKLVYAFGQVVGSVASIGATIAENITGGFKKYISQNSNRIKSHMVTMFDLSGKAAEITGNFAEATAGIFEIFRGETATQLTADIIGIFDEARMGVTEVATTLGVEFLDFLTRPIIENKDAIAKALENTLGPIQTVAETIKNSIASTFDKLREVYDERIAPVFEKMKQAWSETVGKLVEMYNTHIAPMLDEFSKEFQKTFEEYIQPALDKGIEAFGKLTEAVGWLWDKLMIFIGWLSETFGPLFGKITNGLGEAFNLATKYIGELTDTLFSIFGGLIDFLLGVFTGDWERVWWGLVDIFKGIINLIPMAFEALINGIIWLINAIIDGINWLTGWVGIPEIPRIPEVALPRLAEGGIVDNPTVAMIGEAGKEAVVPLENNTGWMVALANVIGDVLASKMAMNQGSADTSGQQQNRMVLELDGREMGEALLDYILDAANRRGIQLAVSTR